MMALKLSKLSLNNMLFLQFKTRFHISVLMKQGQCYVFVCQTEMSAMHNCLAVLICINRLYEHTGIKFYVERWLESCLNCLYRKIAGTSIWP